jgi:putative flippase GtrA
MGMSELLVRAVHLWEKRDTPEARKVFKYTMVSVITTVFSNVVLIVVYGLLHLGGEVTSTVFANALATIPSYHLNRKWAWGKSGRSHVAKEIIPFWTMAAAGIIFAMVGAAVVRHVSIQHNLNHTVTSVLVVVANIVSFSIFWVLKLLLFNRLFHSHPLEELDELVEAA